jgi:UDP-N-acetylmuramate--alanine ligase
MCGIAEMFHNQGYVISGSDIAGSSTTQRLVSLGITVHIGHSSSNIGGANCVVTSTAVKLDNPEVIAAKAARIPVVPRAVMLAELMRSRKGIAIAGTHGKTSTTSLAACVLDACKQDPTFVIGGKLNSAGANAQLGKGEYIVVEADESDASFLKLLPVMAVVTNIDQDHMDTYEHSYHKLKQAFVDFLHKMPFYGAAIVCIDDAGVRDIVGKIERPVITYGLNEGADIRAVNVRAVGATMHFTVQRKDGSDLAIVLNCAGEHNVRNALAVIAMAYELELDDAGVQAGLQSFAGVGRRFQRYGTHAAPAGGTFELIDDYGHHPVEMAATLAAVRGAFPHRRLVLAFQPHRYSRTRDCFEDFVKVCSTTDVLLLTEVYAAGEAPIVAADGRALMRAVRVAGAIEPQFIEKISELPAAVLNTVHAGDVVVCMGAGTIGNTCTAVVDLLKGTA